ncbi:MAG TPA: diphosphomevalonate decarboxylase [Polyangiaceae bacterium]|nr:diphosphomevalonate decarboxylase [Polyangiaceae bacterium]
MSERSVATAVACSNIALIKYWGKSARGQNLTAVPSLSMTLSALRTTTRVSFEPNLEVDRVQIGAEQVSGRPYERVVRLLDEVRALAKTSLRAEVTSNNDFPTASGLASSASGFAALALAAQGALGLGLDSPAVSRLARRASASAARSLYPGFVELLAEGEAASPVAPSDFLDVEMVIAATTLGPKSTASTDGMLHTQATSPYYAAWVESAPALFARGKQALLARDLEALGEAMEASTLAMHACMLAARPSLFYWQDATLRVMQRVRELRQQGTLAFFTMDAGPHVKVLVPRAEVVGVRHALSQVPGVERVLSSSAGVGAFLLEGAA